MIRTKYPELWKRLMKLDRLQDYNVMLYRMNKGMDMEIAINTPIKGRAYKILPIKKELVIPLRYRQNQNFMKPRYYETDKEIERQILFDNKQLTYSIDELSEEEKQMI